MELDKNKVHHVVSGGLVHNRYYRVYVTQVNKNGIESERSEPALIRVGDVYAPPTPHLQVDCAMYPNGTFSRGEFVSVMFKWNDVNLECDDLDHYNWFKFSAWNNYHGDGIYRESDIRAAIARGEIRYETGGMMPATTTHATLDGVIPAQWAWVGIQAVDISRNASDIYILGGAPVDLAQPIVPKEAPHVEPYGIWTIRAWIDCPCYHEVAYVVFYRDGWQQLTPVPFRAGLKAEIYDSLDVIGGLSHFYTYKFITKDGRESEMSPESEVCMAQAVDTSYIDSKVLEDLKTAWNTDIVNSTSGLEEAARQQALETKDIAEKLKDVTKQKDELYDLYRITANKVELLSAKVEEQDGVISALQTSIKQNAEAIQLRATKSDIDKATGQVKNACVSLINVQANRITSLTSDVAGNTSSIAQLSNQIQMKVDKGYLKSEINLAIQNGISVATITADRIVLTGQMLMQGNARIHGRLYSDDIALVDSKTNQVVWGAGTGTIHPTVLNGVISKDEFWIVNGGEGRFFQPISSWREIGSWTFTPKPKVNFNGNCTVRITLSFFVGTTSYEYYSVGEGLRRWHIDALANTYACVNTTCNQWDYGNAVRLGDGGIAEVFDTHFKQWAPQYNWHITDIQNEHFNHLAYKQVTVSCTAQCPIGQTQQAKIWLRSDGNNRHDVTGLAYIAGQGTWHIEVV